MSQVAKCIFNRAWLRQRVDLVMSAHKMYVKKFGYRASSCLVWFMRHPSYQLTKHYYFTTCQSTFAHDLTSWKSVTYVIDFSYYATHIAMWSCCWNVCWIRTIKCIHSNENWKEKRTARRIRWNKCCVPTGKHVMQASASWRHPLARHRVQTWLHAGP